MKRIGYDSKEEKSLKQERTDESDNLVAASV